jgi:hypothetical protein
MKTSAKLEEKWTYSPPSPGPSLLLLLRKTWPHFSFFASKTMTTSGYWSEFEHKTFVKVSLALRKMFTSMASISHSLSNMIRLAFVTDGGAGKGLQIVFRRGRGHRSSRMHKNFNRSIRGKRRDSTCFTRDAERERCLPLILEMTSMKPRRSFTHRRLSKARSSKRLPWRYCASNTNRSRNKGPQEGRGTSSPIKLTST